MFKLLADNNRPAASTSKARLRLVHGVGGLGSGLTLTLEVTSPLSASALYSGSDLTLTAQGVYSMFLLGGAASAVGVLRRDR